MPNGDLFEVAMIRTACVGMILLVPKMAIATYSPPLNEVRIDRNVVVHTPSLVYASEDRSSRSALLTLEGYGAQYVGQFEWETGYGLQVGLAAGVGRVDGTIDDARQDVATSGLWAGGQLRAYKMLWKSEVDEALVRPSAVTAFINVRGFHYRMRSGPENTPVELNFINLTGGLGAMAEISLNDYVSICPYAWMTPGLFSRSEVAVAGQTSSTSGGFTLRTPFLVGVDIWIYSQPPNWDSHISLSILGSFIDTQGNDNTFAVVVGYTF